MAMSRTALRLVYPLLGLSLLCVCGSAWETHQRAADRRLVAPGRLVDVGGRRLHLRCAGTGTPTVVLEAGLGETQAYWEWVLSAVAADTPVCAYDRAGRGWSDPPSSPQDGLAVAADLANLLERGRVPGPFVLVGHSSGAQYVRIFAGRYPARVAGVVFLDGQPSAAFDGLPTYPLFYGVARRVIAVLPMLARLGVGRALVSSNQALPAPVRDSYRRQHASTSYFRSLRDEFEALPVVMAQARGVQSLGDRPLVVVSAAEDAQAGWLPLQQELVGLSSNRSHRIVPCTHEALVTDRTVARISVRAIADVVHAVRAGANVNTPW